MIGKRSKLHRSVAVAVAVTAAWGAAAVYWQRHPAPPRISLETAEVLLPKSRIGDEHPISVGIRNLGGSTLRLTIAGITCGCSRVGLEQETVQPGESTKLVGTVHAKGASGSFSSRIGIASNDPKMPFAEVVVRGDVEPYVRVWPPTITLRPDMRKPAVAGLRVQNTDAKSVTISVAVLGSPARSSKAKVTLGPKEATVIDFSCGADVVQYGQGRVHLNTDHHVQSAIVVPIHIAPCRSFSVSPAKIHFGMISRSDIASKRFTLFVTGPLAQSAKIRELSVPVFLRLAGQRTNRVTGAIEIELAFSDEWSKGTVNGTVEVHVDLEDQPIRTTVLTVSVGGIIH